MIISLAHGDKIIKLDVLPNEQVYNVKVLVQVETGIPINSIAIFFRGRELNDSERLNIIGVTENTVLYVNTKQRQQQQTVDIDSLASSLAAGLARNVGGGGGRPVSGMSGGEGMSPDLTDPNVFRSYVMSDPNLLTNLLHNDKDLAEAVLSEDNVLLSAILNQRTHQKQLKEQQAIAEIERLNADPLNVEAQAAIAGKIQEENVLENMETAMEHHPESFGRVVMLYIEATVNGVPIKAFVDSGAQRTIMSVECAERCRIMRLLDRRFGGIAYGVGSARIIGRVHLAPIQIGKMHFPCSFDIMEGQNVEFLLGLDMLRRHQCCIDLQANELRIQTEKVPFLSEKDIPAKELNQEITEEQEKLLLQQQQQQQQQLSSTSTSTTQKPTSTSTSTTSTSTSTGIPAPAPSPSPAPVPVPAPAPAPTPVWTPSTSVPQQARSSVSTTQNKEGVIRSLMDLGYTRSQVLQALSLCNDDAEMAASYLFSAMFG